MRLTVLNVSYPLAHVSPATAGGAEPVLLTLDQALVRSGHRSIVIAPAGSRTHGLLLPIPRSAKNLDEQAKQRACSENAKAIQLASRPSPSISFIFTGSISWSTCRQRRFLPLSHCTCRRAGIPLPRSTERCRTFIGYVSRSCK